VIGALQKGNGLKRSRDRRKKGYERYVALGILGRNLQTLGKLLLDGTFMVYRKLAQDVAGFWNTMAANAAASANTTYYVDQIHPTDAGHIIGASYVGAQIVLALAALGI
jgi:hypothetical protein